MDQFSEIRPYLDHEVKKVLETLIGNAEVLKALMGLRYPSYLSKIPFIKFLAKQRLKSQSRNITTIDEYQSAFKILMDGMIHETISNFSVRGVTELNPANSYLFISNHRDIALDAALLNVSLYKSNHKTFNMAVGNNLMQEKWASDLMRLNKSFIIQRSGTKKEIYTGLSLASKFIQHTLFKTNESVWIAQSQGRAKDGIDNTDPAMLKMIHLTERKTQPLGNYFNSLKIVPVSISYEFDPNDCLKAIELSATEEHQYYKKEKNEDLNSIANGIKGQKGNVAINVGQPMDFSDEDGYEDIADQITKSIISMYQLQPTNYAAAEILGIEREPISNFNNKDILHAKKLLEQRMINLDTGERSKFLDQYANPVVQKNRLNCT
jgi:hypothetical protein